MLSSDSDSEYEVQSIVDKRKRGRIIEYKVKWRGYDSGEDSWVPRSQLSGSRALVTEYENSLKTRTKSPSRAVKKETIRSVKTVGDTKSRTKTTTTITEDNFSASSSPDSSPALRRRVVRTEETTVLSGQGDVASPKRIDLPSPSRMDIASPSRIAESGKCTMTHLAKMDWSIYVLLFCILAIVLSFVFEDVLKKF